MSGHWARGTGSSGIYIGMVSGDGIVDYREKREDIGNEGARSPRYM